jgi:hypothetical protein
MLYIYDSERVILPLVLAKNLSEFFPPQDGHLNKDLQAEC